MEDDVKVYNLKHLQSLSVFWFLMTYLLLLFPNNLLQMFGT